MKLSKLVNPTQSISASKDLPPHPTKSFSIWRSPPSSTSNTLIWHSTKSPLSATWPPQTWRPKLKLELPEIHNNSIPGCYTPFYCFPSGGWGQPTFLAIWEPTSAPGKAHPELQQSPYVLSWVTPAAAATSPSSALSQLRLWEFCFKNWQRQSGQKPPQDTQLTNSVMSYWVWCLHFQLSPVISMCGKYCLKIYIPVGLFLHSHLHFTSLCFTWRKPCQNTPESLRQRKTTILSPIDWLEGFSVPVTHQDLYLISAFHLIVMIEEGDF